MTAMCFDDLYDPKLLEILIDVAKDRIMFWEQVIQSASGLQDERIFLTQWHLKYIGDGLKALESGGHDRTAAAHVIPTFAANLKDINSTLIVSSALSVPFYDWDNYLPLYRYKLGRVARSAVQDDVVDPTREVLRYFVPNFKISSMDHIYKLRKDKRLDGLKSLMTRKQERPIPESLNREVTLDMLSFRNEVDHYSKIVSWMTFPLSLIPVAGPLFAKAVEEIVGRTVKRNLENKYSWQSLLVDLRTKYTCEHIR
jgi:hypothetical protein